jgi:uncharacterized protein
VPRPPCPRRLGALPPCTAFVPSKPPAQAGAPVTLHADGWEALRLSDHKGLDHERAAKTMGVSRQTYGRILDQARRTVSQALIEGRRLCIGLPDGTQRHCPQCQHHWQAGTTCERSCPACQHAPKIVLISPPAQEKAAP